MPAELGLIQYMSGGGEVYGQLDAGGDWRFTDNAPSIYGCDISIQNIDGQFYAGYLGRTIEEFASHVTIRNTQGEVVDLSTLAGASYLNVSADRYTVTLVGKSSIRFNADNMVTIRHDSGLLTVNCVRIS